MKYDIIIIGGGLSGLAAGVKLASAKKKVAIITSGQSALHFSSGSAALLGAVDGKPVTNPLEGAALLADTHPYKKIGLDRLGALADETAELLNEAGIKMEGRAERSHYRLTPLGMWAPAWLSMEGLVTIPKPGAAPWKKAAIVNLHGYLDFYPEYIAAGLKEAGVESTECEVSLPELAHLRKSCSEMRAASIAKILRGETLKKLAAEINRVTGDAEVVVMPAVVGLKSDAECHELASMVKRPLLYVPVIPMSVMGVRAELLLRRRFESLGGTYLIGDSVRHGQFEGNRLSSIETALLGSGTPLEAEEYLLATGSFFSQGLKAKPDEIIEPVFGLDVDQTADRMERYQKDFFAPQPYMRFGVKTDSDFRVSAGGKTIDNLRAIGSILSGADSIAEGSGAGVALLTALEAANRILSSK